MKKKKREIRDSLFQVLEGGLVGGKILKSFSVTQKKLHVFKELLYNFTLDGNIMVQKRPIFDSRQVR